MNFYRKIFFFVIFLMIGFMLSSQNQKVQNLRNYDRDNFHLGYTLGLNSGDFSIRNSDAFFETDMQVYSIEAKQNVGFQFGAISNVRLGEYFDLRMLLYASFNQRNLQYTLLKTDKNDERYFETYEMAISSTFLEFPISLKYKSARINNYRVYLIGGVNPKLDPVHIIKKEYIQPENPRIRLQPYDLLMEIGIGLDLYSPYFKFAPELKFGFGMMDIMQPDNTVYTQSAKYIKSRMVMLSFHFE